MVGVLYVVVGGVLECVVCVDNAIDVDGVKL